jgi:outer membrane immunogenic protein
MKKFVLSTFAAAAALSVAAPAFAADIPGRRAPQGFEPRTIPAFTWTGFYVGLNAGTVWGDFTKEGKVIDAKTGFTGGLTVGYNQQIGQQFVAGLEADYNYSGLGGRGFAVPSGAVVKGDMTSFGTIRGRLGMSFDRALVYATGGYAFGFSKISGPVLSETATHHGYALGVGLEYAFTNNISAKAEYLYMPLSGQSALAIPGAPAGAKTGIDASVIRAGVNYRF